MAYTRLAKDIVQRILRKFGKRITNLDAPAKPFRYGVEFLKDILPRVSIIDIGVGDGTPDLTHAYPLDQYQYLLIEANPKFFPYLDSLKTKYPNTIVEKCFCGEVESTALFHLNKSGLTSSRYSTVGTTGDIEVPVKTLDTIVAKNKISTPLLLKIDAEGAEIDVLSGATETLKLCEAVILESWINVEVNNQGRDFASIVSFMKQNSFIIFDFFGGHSFRNGILAHVDLVFVRENSPYRMLR